MNITEQNIHQINISNSNINMISDKPLYIKYKVWDREIIGFSLNLEAYHIDVSDTYVDDNTLRNSLKEIIIDNSLQRFK